MILIYRTKNDKKQVTAAFETNYKFNRYLATYGLSCNNNRINEELTKEEINYTGTRNGMFYIISKLEYGYIIWYINQHPKSLSKRDIGLFIQEKSNEGSKLQGSLLDVVRELDRISTKGEVRL